LVFLTFTEAKQPWNRSEPDSDIVDAGGNWAVIGNLTPGERYYFRVVAVSGTEPDQRETPSHPPRLIVIGSDRGTVDSHCFDIIRLELLRIWKLKHSILANAYLVGARTPINLRACIPYERAVSILMLNL
jgi:hypothetical protein